MGGGGEKETEKGKERGRKETGIECNSVSFNLNDLTRQELEFKPCLNLGND